MKKYKYDIGDVVLLKDRYCFDYPFDFAGRIAIIVEHTEQKHASYWAIISGTDNTKQIISIMEIQKKL